MSWVVTAVATTVVSGLVSFRGAQVQAQAQKQQAKQAELLAANRAQIERNNAMGRAQDEQFQSGVADFNKQEALIETNRQADLADKQIAASLASQQSKAGRAGLAGGSFEDILNAVSKLNSEGIPIELHLYGERFPKSFLEREISQKGIIHHGLVMPLEKKYEIMKNADAFVIPSSFDHKINQDYQYSFPTKLTEFIASGKPVIYYGPNNTATSNFCKKHKGINVIDTKSQNSIFNTLGRLINDYQNLKSASKENSESIKDTLSKEIILNNFHNHLLRVISE